MGKKPGSNNHSDELKEEVALSREQLARNLRGIRYELDLPRKIRRSIRREPLPWIATAAAAGIFVVLMVSRQKKIYVNAKPGGKAPAKFVTMGLALGVLRFGATLLKPMIIKFVEKKLAGMGTARRPAAKW